MPRGGSRTATPGASYPQRTDLQQNPANGPAPRALPVTVPPSAQYGQGVALANAQKQVPTANAPLPTPSPLQTAPGSQDPTASQQAQQGPPPVLPGQVTGLDAPTQNPAEHVMTGVPSGPGGGPEVMPPNSAGVPAQFGSVRDLVQSLVKTNPSPALTTLAMYSGNSL